MGEFGWETTFKTLERAYGCPIGMKFLENEVSNTSQLVMFPGNNERNHSQASSCRVCENNQHGTLY